MPPTTKTDKEHIISRILRNEVYMPDSGLVEQLTRRLLAWPVGDLRNLELILAIKSGSMKK